MSNHPNSLDIIIPCFNPEPGWEDKLIKYYQEIASKTGLDRTSLILVNDGSTDQVTTEQIEKIKGAVPEMVYLNHKQNKGKGHALRAGVEASSSGLMIFTDVDFPYEVDSIFSVYQELCNGTDVVLGYRAQDYYTTVPLFRKILSKQLRWLLRSVLKLTITDTQCGLKGFNQSGKSIFLSTTINRFLFDLEFVLLISKDPSISTRPVLVRLREGVVFSKVNMKVLAVELFNFFKLALFTRKPSKNA